MSTAPVERTTFPGGRLYHSDRGLYEFQQDGIARAYLGLAEGSGVWMATWDTGTGKTHLAMALSALMVEDAAIDLVLVVCEKNKISEWVADYEKFTTLSVRKHYGPNRTAHMTKFGLPQVLVSVYETVRQDAATFTAVKGKRAKQVSDGPLLDLVRGKRVLVVYDESTKLKNRSSQVYKSHERMLKSIAKAGTCKVLELTATPVERDYEDTFNQLRIAPNSGMPLVKWFEEVCVKYRDPFDRPTYNNPLVEQFFLPVCHSKMHRVRKTDPEVRAQFPKQMEENRHFQMGDEQAEFYALVRDLGIDDETGEVLEDGPDGLWTLLRQIAGHPASLLSNRTKVAQMLVEEIGATRIMGIPSVKTQGLVDYLEPLVQGQGAKAVAFTFFGQSVLPLLEQALTKKKMVVYSHHGGMSSAQQDAARAAFRADERPAVFLTSDAGARGLNLPEALYVVNYELPLTHSGYTQRINRVHRIDSEHPSVTAMSFLLDECVESGIGLRMLSRNLQQDHMLGDHDLEDEASAEKHISADDRRRMLKIVREKKRK